MSRERLALALRAAAELNNDTEFARRVGLCLVRPGADADASTTTMLCAYLESREVPKEDAAIAIAFYVTGIRHGMVVMGQILHGLLVERGSALRKLTAEELLELLDRGARGLTQ